MTASALLSIGLDVGDRFSHLCAVDGDRQVAERLRFPTSPEGVRRVLADRPPARVVVEAGSQSPWMSDQLRDLGHDVLVADARRVAAITR